MYRNLMTELILDPTEYSQLKRGFMGGFTHASNHHVMRETPYKDVACYDFCSSYPAVMVMEKFPMSRGQFIPSMSVEELETMTKTHCLLFDLTLNWVFPKLHHEHPISYSKTFDRMDVVGDDNGRVVTAEKFTITVTEQDYFVFREFYSWDFCTITNVWVYRKDYLPRNLVNSILTAYARKTELKDVKGMEIEYQIAKELVNAIYGMCATDPVRDSIEYLNNSEVVTPADIEKSIIQYNNSKKRFLFYPWGLWVTAYARANLFSGIIAFGSDYIYSDTDSIYALNYEAHTDYIDAYNSEIYAKIIRASKAHNIIPSAFSPKTVDGKIKTIGLWEFKGISDEFKTLGAKRYLKRSGDKYELTVAGVNKQKALDYILAQAKKLHVSPFDIFTPNLAVPPEFSKRLDAYYEDEEFSGNLVDYTGVSAPVHEKSAVNLMPIEYSFHPAEDFVKYLKLIREISE